VLLLHVLLFNCQFSVYSICSVSRGSVLGLHLFLYMADLSCTRRRHTVVCGLSLQRQIGCCPPTLVLHHGRLCAGPAYLSVYGGPFMHTTTTHSCMWTVLATTNRMLSTNFSAASWTTLCWACISFCIWRTFHAHADDTQLYVDCPCNDKSDAVHQL